MPAILYLHTRLDFDVKCMRLAYLDHDCDRTPGPCKANSGENLKNGIVLRSPPAS